MNKKNVNPSLEYDAFIPPIFIACNMKRGSLRGCPFNTFVLLHFPAGISHLPEELLIFHRCTGISLPTFLP
jgi:hypothetical protein